MTTRRRPNVSPDLRRIGESHDGLQSPISAEKIRLLGSRMHLTAGQTVLDIGAGTAGPAVILARQFGCRVVAVEQDEEFARLGRERAASADVADLIAYHVCDGAEFPIETGAYDAAVCIGAAWILGGFGGTAVQLRDAVRLGGHVAIGDLFASPIESGTEPATPTLRDMLTTMIGLDLAPISMAAASYDDWDEYHSRMMLAGQDWIDAHAHHPATGQVREMPNSIEGTLRQREMGWALLAGRKRAPDHVMTSLSSG